MAWAEFANLPWVRLAILTVPTFSEFLLLVGAGGAIQGLLTPVLPLWFPNLPFFFFAICHAGTFLAPYFVLAVHPELCPRNFIYGYFRQMGAANVILLFVSCINWLIGSNYMYSCRLFAVCFFSFMILQKARWCVSLRCVRALALVRFRC